MSVPAQRRPTKATVGHGPCARIKQVFAPLGKKGLIVALLAALLAIGAQAGCGPGERTQGPEKSVAPGVVATATIATATATRPSPPAWTSDPLGNARPGEVIHAVRTN